MSYIDHNPKIFLLWSWRKKESRNVHIKEAESEDFDFFLIKIPQTVSWIIIAVRKYGTNLTENNKINTVNAKLSTEVSMLTS